MLLKLTSALAFVGSVLGAEAPCSYTFDGAMLAQDKLQSYMTAFNETMTRVAASNDPAVQIQSFARRENKMREVVSMLEDLEPFYNDATNVTGFPPFLRVGLGRRLSSSGNADPGDLFKEGYDLMYNKDASFMFEDGVKNVNDMYRRSVIGTRYNLASLLPVMDDALSQLKDVLSGLPTEHGFSGKNSSDFASSNPCSVGVTSLSLLTAKLCSNKPDLVLLEALDYNHTAQNVTIGKAEFDARYNKMISLDVHSGLLETAIKTMQRVVDIRGMTRPSRRLAHPEYGHPEYGQPRVEVVRKVRALEGMLNQVADVERRFVIMKCEVEPKLERIVAGVEEVLSNASACGDAGDDWVCEPTFSETPSWCAQAADVCAGTLFFPPTWCSLPSSPSPPTLPSSADEPADEEFAVSFTLTASGDVSDYTPTVRDAMATKVATTAGVDKSKVSVLVTAGSVNIAITITAATATAARTAGAAVQSSSRQPPQPPPSFRACPASPSMLPRSRPSRRPSRRGRPPRVWTVV